MKKLFTGIIITSFIAAAITFLPSLLIVSLLEIDAVYAVIFSLLFFLLSMIVLPVPMLISYSRERKTVLKLAQELGDKCFIWKVGIYTKEHAVNGYLCFNAACLHIVGKIKNTEYRIVLPQNKTKSIEIENTVNIVIKTVNDKCYRIVSSQSALIEASLIKNGWKPLRDDSI